MDGEKQLQQLLNYDLWANQKAAAVLNSAPSKIEQCMIFFAHIGAAQEIWYKRINGRKTAGIELWPVGQPVDHSLEMIHSMHKKWLKLLEKSNLDEVISYKKSNGTKFNTPLAGILHHVIIHGQHHRAQIATLLRQNNINPPATDFIFYLREI